MVWSIVYNNASAAHGSGLYAWPMRDTARSPRAGEPVFYRQPRPIGHRSKRATPRIRAPTCKLITSTNMQINHKPWAHGRRHCISPQAEIHNVKQVGPYSIAVEAFQLRNRTMRVVLLKLRPSCARRSVRGILVHVQHVVRIASLLRCLCWLAWELTRATTH